MAQNIAESKARHAPKAGCGDALEAKRGTHPKQGVATRQNEQRNTPKTKRET